MRTLPKLFRRAIKTGTLILNGPKGYRETFGDGTGVPVEFTITDPRLDWRIPLKPELAPPEAYMDGTLRFERGGPYEMMALFFGNRREFDLTPSQIFWRGVMRGSKRLLRNTTAKARRNAAHHYDVGNAFYRLWLDRDLQYSCGYFPEGTETLEEAQTLKKRHIAAKLHLQPGQRVLDIGCGWGGMALYLAQVADVKVVGVTLAEEQLAHARRRAEALGLSDRVEFRLMDYRAVTETFDRVVSVGMLEHVGARDLTAYFLKVRDCLAPGGVALIHSISSKSPPGLTAPFIDKYIFPGGYLPRLSESFAAVEKAGLWTLDTESWRVHYSRTIQHWRQRFDEQRETVVEQYDERFARMWEFYLALSDIVFTHSTNFVFQMQLGRTRDGVPLHRDYIAEAAARYAAREPAFIETQMATGAQLLGTPVGA